MQVVATQKKSGKKHQSNSPVSNQKSNDSGNRRILTFGYAAPGNKTKNLNQIQGNSPTQRSIPLDFNKISLFSPQSAGIHPKLKINQPNDKYEQEADRIADQVMRARYAPAGGQALAPDIMRLPAIYPAVQHKTGNKEEEYEMLQTKIADRSGASQSTDVAPLIGRVLQGSGQPLPDTVRASMEPSFGVDFSGVRLHAGSEAAAAAGAINSRAFTSGNDIVFGAGEKQLQTPSGQHLLAHELTHVVQQQSGRSQHVQRQVPGTELTSEEEDTFEPSGRSTHEWRTALIGARNDMVGHMMDAKQEFFQRHSEAMNQFERTMSFASEESAAGLILKAELNELMGQLPSPVSTIVTQVTIVSDAFQQSSASTDAVNLDTWIEQKRNALQEMHEATIDPDSWSEITDINTRIESLVNDSSTEAERERQQWELSMLNSSFGVGPTAQEIEFALYDEWCYKQGAYFVFHTYQTDRHYPGYQEIGRTDQSHPAFRGEQRWARNVPSQILDRLHRLGLRPERTLTLPTETVAHDRVSEAHGGLNPEYSRGDVFHHMPYRGEREENWTGPERFRQ